MTPLLFFSYALSVAGGLFLLGVVSLLLFGAVLWLLGGRASARSATPSAPPAEANVLGMRGGSGITGHREP